MLCQTGHLFSLKKIVVVLFTGSLKSPFFVFVIKQHPRMSQSIFAHVCHLAVKLKTLFCRYEFAQNYYFFPQNIIFLETGTENNPFQKHKCDTIQCLHRPLVIKTNCALAIQ